LRENASRKRFAGLVQLVPAPQTGDAGESITTPVAPEAPAAPELAAPQAVAAATATARIGRRRVITAALA
jgi:hypothetical protein